VAHLSLTYGVLAAQTPSFSLLFCGCTFTNNYDHCAFLCLSKYKISTFWTTFDFLDVFVRLCLKDASV
jgi:hypothetical protein